MTPPPGWRARDADRSGERNGRGARRTMSRSILGFYRSAVPNVAADRWKDVTGPLTRAASFCFCPTRPRRKRCNISSTSLGEFGLPTPNQQPENCGEHKLSEGEEHRPIIPGPATCGFGTLMAAVLR